MYAAVTSAWRRTRSRLLVALMPAVIGLAADAAAPTDVPQIPLCMVGDSITWAGDGDYWRKYLLDELPALAFVGTHSGKLGFSHAGEGGNSTGAVLKRMRDIPDCPYYALEIGTNNNNVKDGPLVKERAAKTAEQIELIVKRLLAKPSVKKVFLGSVLPCQTKNPLRDQTNSATNVVLRQKLDSSLRSSKIVWVEYEKPIRATPNWGPMIRLHPTRDGYKLLAKVLADALVEALDIDDRAAAPKPGLGAGVRVENLWDDAQGRTRTPIIAGWYTVSFALVAVTGARPTVVVRSVGKPARGPFEQSFPVAAADVGRRVTVDFFTHYEGYHYTRSAMTVVVHGCEIEKLLFEKRRPCGEASTYGVGSYIDTKTPPMPGELVELQQTSRPSGQ